MESDALHQASSGEVPDGIIKQFPEGQSHYVEITERIDYKD